MTFTTRIVTCALMALLLAPLAGTAQANTQWNRYPAISPDGETIVFTYRGDLYRVPTEGGVATALTAHVAHDFMPVWSSDGRWIAFASDRHGNFDVYAMPAEGGSPTRLTHHSAADYPYSFNSEGDRVYFGSARLDRNTHRGYPTGSQPELYSVPSTGGRVHQVLTTPAEEIHLTPGGFLYQDKKGGENAWRKRHQSGIARDIWAYDQESGSHRQLTTFPGEDRDPVLTADGEGFYYLSEEAGTFNVFRRSLDGSGGTQLTSFTGPPVRFLSASDQGTLAFSWDGELYTLEEGAEPVRVPVTVLADAKNNNEEILRISGGIRSFAVSPNGKEVAFIARGEVFVASVEGGVTKQITATPQQEAHVSFSPDGASLVYGSERDGRWGIYKAVRVRDQEPYFYASTLIREESLIVNANENSQPLFSPSGEELAFVENRSTIRILELESGDTRTLLGPDHVSSTRIGGLYFRWSPDGSWILFNQSIPGIAPGEVGLVSSDGGPVQNLTMSGFRDYGGQWVMGGEAMIWASNRDGLKSTAQSGQTQADIYGMFLTQDSWDRFRLSKEDYALLKDQESEEDGEDEEESEETEVTLTLEDAELRKARLTIHSASISGALMSKDGETLYYLARFERGYNLWQTSLRTRETKMLAALNASGAQMAWDNDQESIFVLASGRLSKVDPKNGNRESVSVNGEMVLDRAAERAEMFEHVWTQTNETFYTAGFHGADWAGLKTTHERYLPHIGNGHEFAEMLSELLGELNVSHSGARYGSTAPTDDATASLGAFYDQTSGGAGLTITEVLKNGPLDKSGFQVEAGSVIEAIDGTTITDQTNVARLLNRKAGNRVLLSVRTDGDVHDIVVKPVSLGEERRLRYARWVRRNRDEVAEASGGRLGYIHVPGMNDGAYRTTLEEALGRFATADGLVVDTRFNSGGDLVADLAMFLSGERFFDYTTDDRSSGFEPNFRWTKPSVSLANEANYSDGHCYAYAYQELGLGTLVGMPVPGTCTFAGWEGLADGATRWGVPGLGVKNNAGAYLENLETRPDIEVKNDAAVAGTGRDQQLERAIEELLRVIGN